MQLDMKSHQCFYVTQPKVSLFGKCMMPSLSKVFCTQLNFCFIFTLIKILANLHNRVKISSFCINFNCFFKLLGLLIKVSCFFPMTAILLIFSLFYQNDRIQYWSVSQLFCSVLNHNSIYIWKLS